MDVKNKVSLGVIWIFLGYLCASTSGLTQALAPQDASPLSIGAVRILTGGIFLLLAGIITKKLPDLKVLPKKSVFLATLGLMLFQLCFFAAVKMVGVAIGSVIGIGVVPIVSGIAAWILLNEKPSRIWYISTFFMLLGLIALGLSGGVGEYGFSLTGIFLAALAGSGYGVFLVLIKPALKTNGSAEIMTVVFLLGGILLFPVVLANPMGWIFTSHGALVILNLGGVTAAMAFFLILYGLKTTSANIGGALSITEPFFAALWGIFFLSEQVGFQGYVGLALILCSSILLVLPQKNTPEIVKD